MSRHLFTACVAALVVAAVSPAATAADSSRIQSASIKISDLNLATDRGVDTLLRRVNAVADDLCAQIDSPLNRGAHLAEVKCHDKAMASAIARLNVPTVSAGYARRYGAAPSVVASR